MRSPDGPRRATTEPSDERAVARARGGTSAARARHERDRAPARPGPGPGPTIDGVDTGRTRLLAAGVVVVVVLGLSLVNRVVFDRTWAGTLGSAAGVITGIVLGVVVHLALARRRGNQRTRP